MLPVLKVCLERVHFKSMLPVLLEKPLVYEVVECYRAFRVILLIYFWPVVLVWKYIYFSIFLNISCLQA